MDVNRDSLSRNLFLALVVSLMAGCVALSLAEFVRSLLPWWNVSILVAGCMVAAAEAHFSYRWVQSRSMYHTDGWKLRLTELLVLFVLLKVGYMTSILIGRGWPELLAEMRTWPSAPRNAIDPETALAFICSVVVWLASTQIARDLQRLWEPPGLQRDERPPLQSLTGLFFSVGAVLLVFSGLARVSMADLTNLRRASISGVVVNALVYFLMGLVLLAQARLIVLRRDWQENKIQIAPDLTGRWVRYSLAFLVLAAALAFLLPTGYTMGLLDAARTVIGFAFRGLELVIRWLVYLASLPLALLLWLVGRGEEPGPPPEAPTPQLAPSLPDAAPPPAWSEVLQSLLSWALVLGIAFYVVYTYLHEHPELLARLAALAPVRAFRRLWDALRSRLGVWAKAVRRRLRRRVTTGREASEPSAKGDRGFWHRVESSRDRVVYYYLSALRRASRQGLPRKSFQTPYEYDETVQPNLPDAHQEMGLLTHAFVEAKYSSHLVAPNRVSQVRILWRKVRAALRALRPARPAARDDYPASSPGAGDQ